VKRRSLRSSGQRQQACRHVLIGRSLERIGDNAVDICRAGGFLETHRLREFTDASKPMKRLNCCS